MAKRRKNGQMSDSELETRRHHASLRRLKVYCSDMNVELKDYKSILSDLLFEPFCDSLSVYLLLGKV